MKYSNITYGKFVERPNRFIAIVLIDGVEEIVHVKNTGRCRELLISGVQVGVLRSDNPDRKTKWDLISVYKENLGWINIDSQVPNVVVGEWLRTENSIFIEPDIIKSEYNYKSSRIDFYIEKDNRKILMEVKGCTLEIDGTGYFPDAPTKRGVKHLKELIKAVQEGYEAYITFVIAMNNIEKVHPNEKTDKEFAQTYYNAINAGVKVLFLCCAVESDEIFVKSVQIEG